MTVISSTKCRYTDCKQPVRYYESAYFQGYLCIRGHPQ